MSGAPGAGSDTPGSPRRALPGDLGGDLAAELAAGGLVEAVHGQPVPDPRPAGVRAGHHVVDVVQAPRGGLVLQVLQDEGADAAAALSGRDDEGDPGVAPFGVEPAVPGDLGAVGPPPPLVRDRLAWPRFTQAGRGQ